MTSVEPINNFETNNRRSTTTTGRRKLPRTEPVGRYDGSRSKTWHPSDGLGAMPKSRNADTTVAAVTDPYGNGTERILATVNRRVDLLEQERSHGRISDAAYHNGRLVQEIFERANHLQGCNWLGGSGLDPAEARATKIEKAVENAIRIKVLLTRIRNHIGMIDTRLLRRILDERMSFAECAALQGRAGDRGERYVASRFREALEALSEAWTARGKVPAAPTDQYAVDPAALQERQDASLDAGATLERLLAELAELGAGGGKKRDIAVQTELVADMRLRQATSRARRVRS